MADFRFYPDPPAWSDLTRQAFEGDADDLLALIPERERALEDYLKALAASVTSGGGGGGGSGTDVFLVAGVDAPAAVKAAANAVCDGVDDQVELNASPGGVVVAVGTFYITGTVSVSALIGYAPNAGSPTARTTIAVGSGSYTSSTAVSTRTLAGVRIATSSSTVGLLAQADATHSCLFVGPSNGSVTGLTRRSGQVALVTMSEFTGLAVGVDSSGVDHQTSIASCRFTDCASAAADAFALVSCRATKNSNTAWQTGALVDDCLQVVGCTLQDSGANYPVLVTSVSRWDTPGVVSGNTVIGGSVGISVGLSGSSISMGPVVSGNTVAAFTQAGISASGRVAVSGNSVAAARSTDVPPANSVGIRISGTATNNADGGLVSNNRVAEVDVGIEVDGDEHAVVGNLVRETLGDAIRVTAVSDDSFISTNDCLGGVINDLGTGTVLANNRI